MLPTCCERHEGAEHVVGVAGIQIPSPIVSSIRAALALARRLGRSPGHHDAAARV